MTKVGVTERNMVGHWVALTGLGLVVRTAYTMVDSMDTFQVVEKECM
jgi:hypothetical protein